MNLISKQLASDIESLKNKKSDLEKQIGVSPTRELDKWDKKGWEEECVGYKFYSYNMTYFNQTQGTNTTSAFDTVDFSGGTKDGPSGIATSKEQADLCRKYNDLIRDCKSKCIDIKYLLSFKRNLEDKKIYKLNAKELLTLGF